MNGNRLGLRLAGTLLALAATAAAGTFGTVVPIGGQAADIALDEARGVVYIANFTANRIDVLALSDNTIHSSMNVAPQPGSLALSPDGQFLVIAHFSNFASPSNAVTVINLNSNGRRTFTLNNPPLGVAFGIDGLALLVTTNDFLLLDPATGNMQDLGTISGVAAISLPVAPPNFPPQIIAASLAPSGDGWHIYGLSDTMRFVYNVATRQVLTLGYISSPTMGPRVVSVSRDGSYYAAGWVIYAASGINLAQFASPLGLLNVGSLALDSDSNTLYAEVPSSSGTTPAPTTPPPSGGTPPSSGGTVQAGPPRLQILDSDNLAVRETLQLPEHLAGRSVFNSAHDTVYAVSDSGLMILPVGALNQAHRLAAGQQDLIFRGNFCDQRPATQSLSVTDPGGGHTDFTITSTLAGVSVYPATGTTPAVVQVTVDPSVYLNQRGTVAGSLKLTSASAVNLPAPVRVLVNNREPDQRGTIVDVPGTLVDVLADPVRNRFYVLRQDQNQVLVFDGSTYTQIATLRTSNTPTQMAITWDQNSLIIGHDNSQVAYVYDLNSLQRQMDIVFPPGHYPRSIAASGNALLAAVRSAAGPNAIDRIDMYSRTASMPASLGIFTNSINPNTVLAPTPNGSNILAVSADGTTMLYDASADTFTVARKDFSALSGTYAASSYGQYVVDNNVLNASLVPVTQLDKSAGQSSGFAFVDSYALRSTAPSATSPGVIQRVDLAAGKGIRPTRMVEAPLTGSAPFALVRTLAPLANRTAVVSLTSSGFTVLPWNYDAAVAPPQLGSVVNAADYTKPVAPGGLVSIFGSQMSPVNIATNEMPLPTALGESCLTLNGIPMPMLYVSSSQINGQIPFNVDGNATLVLHTPGGVSDNFYLNILPAAPSVFRSGTAGPDTGIATVVRLSNNELVTGSNPVHPDDQLVIYATGLGRTSPTVPSGVPAPADPLPLAQIAPTVTLGGSSLQVLYAGLAPGWVGVYQINVAVPHGVPQGMTVPLTIAQGGSSTTLNVRVVK